MLTHLYSQEYLSQLENTNDERAREAEKRKKLKKIETAKQHTAIEDTVDNTAVTSNDNQSDDSNN